MSRIMKPNPWGDEPAMPHIFKHASECVNCRQGDCEWTSTAAGFTKLERACIDLKVPHPDLPPELRELILESRRLDWKARHFPKK